MTKNLTLIGMMGAGKSLIAEKLANRLKGYIAIDTDVLIEYHHNQFIPEIFAKKGEEFFRDIETEIIDMVYKKNGMIVAIGGGAFERAQNREIIQKNSKVVFLNASPEVIFERIKDDSTRPVLRKGFDVGTIAEIIAKREHNYKLADFTVVTDGKTPDEIVDEVLEIFHG